MIGGPGGRARSTASEGTFARGTRPDPPRSGPSARTFDAVIVGGGIMGCATTFELAGRGLEVALLEKEAVGAGSTGRSSAIVRQHYSNELTARMALYGLRVFEEFDERVGGECGFRRTGLVVLVPAGDRAGLDENLALQRRVGVRTERLSSEMLDELLPWAATGDVAAGAYEPESGYADPHLTLTAYVAAARRRGAAILQGRRVTGIRFEAGRVTGVETPDGCFHAPVVVNCAGPWAARLAAPVGGGVPIDACRVQVAMFRRPPGYEMLHPTVLDFVNAAYFRPETGGLTLVGLVDPSEADAVVDPDASAGYAEHVEPEFLSDVAGRFVRRCPPMERAGSRGGFAGLYAVTPDWHPIVDEVPAGSGCFVCAGFSGHGFKLGPAVGTMVADLVTGEEAARFDPGAFRLGRFREGRPLRGRYEYGIAG